MIKYVMTAATLKLFSTSPQTKQLYRHLGNTFGQRQRIHYGLSRPYIDRARESWNCVKNITRSSQVIDCLK